MNLRDKYVYMVGLYSLYMHTLNMEKNHALMNRDSLFEDLAFSCLRVPKVHDLIKKFVNENEIVTNAFFL